MQSPSQPSGESLIHLTGKFTPSFTGLDGVQLMCGVAPPRRVGSGLGYRKTNSKETLRSQNYTLRLRRKLGKHLRDKAEQ